MSEAAPRIIGRDEFVGDVRRAVEEGRGYATGKLGFSEKYWMSYEIVLALEQDPRRRIAFEAALRFHTMTQSGIFPSDLQFLRTFNRAYVEAVRQLDCIGFVEDQPDLEHGAIAHYRLSNKLTHFTNQEPDRSSPACDASCYLPVLRGRKLLLVCPFADLLRERATRDTFERVWANTGKGWFAPASVEALEFPYGFEAGTQDRFGTVLDLERHITEELARRQFDVALIAAGGLGIPLAAAAKRFGKVGISLGGHLQVLFGVIGKRWRDRPDWQARYFNDAWIEMPERYRPRTAISPDDGAYW